MKKVILVSLYFLFISGIAFSQYNTCALADANTIVIGGMTSTCVSWTSPAFNMANTTTVTTFPTGDCGAGAPTKAYWLAFIMPTGTATNFSLEFEIVGGSCTSSDLNLLGVSYYVGACGSTTRDRICGFCNTTECSKRSASNAAFTPGTKIFLQIYDNNNTNCDIIMHLYPSPAEDNCITALPFDNTKSYCNKNATKISEGISSPGTCNPKPPHKNAVNSIDNGMWFSFTVTSADPQPYAITMSNIACTGGQKSMQMMVYNASSTCTCANMTPCFVACTAQEEPATTTALTIYPGALADPVNYILPNGNYYLVIDGGNGADCTWSLDDVALPVSLVSFEAVTYKSFVKLDWLVSEEVDNKGYFVQRSSDGKNFIDIGYIEGKGNYVGMLNYEYMDYTPLKSNNYYRLKQEDFDGTFHFSVIRASFVEGVVSVYPNPFSEGFQLGISDPLKEFRYVILNVNGQQVQSEKCTEDKYISLSSCPTGLYNIIVYDCLGEIVLNQLLIKN